MSALSNLEEILESENTFWACFAEEDKIRQAYKAFKHHLKATSKAYDELDQQAAKLAAMKEKQMAKIFTLKEKIKEHRNARMQMKGALSYVKKQLSTLCSANFVLFIVVALPALAASTAFLSFAIIAAALLPAAINI